MISRLERHSPRSMRTAAWSEGLALRSGLATSADFSAGSVASVCPSNPIARSLRRSARSRGLLLTSGLYARCRGIEEHSRFFRMIQVVVDTLGRRRFPRLRRWWLLLDREIGFLLVRGERPLLVLESPVVGTY